MLTKADIQLVRSLATVKGRRQHGLFVAEGHRLVGELLEHLQCRRLWAKESWRSGNSHWLADMHGLCAEIVSDQELARISLQQHPQDVLALFAIPPHDDSATALADAARCDICIALDGVQDPGNMGTIIRAADWFGVHHIICSRDTVDVYNPKVVQATMGGMARVAVHYTDLPQLLRDLQPDTPVYGTSLQGDSLYDAALTPERGIIVMGNEGNGVSSEVAALCNHQLLIPSYPPQAATTESLNVGVATSIMLAEFRRRALSFITSATLVVLTALVTLVSASCSSDKFLTDDQLLLNSVEIRSDNRQLSTAPLSTYIRQHPNARWFSLFKVPLGIYCISGTDSASRTNRFFRRIGQAPVVFDSLLTERSRSDIEAAVRNLGYLDAEVCVSENRVKHHNNISYDIHTGERYYVDSMAFQIADPALDSLLKREEATDILHGGMPFDVNVLASERSRISSIFQNEGYYLFNKSYISFEADTTRGDHSVGLTMSVLLYRPTLQDSLRPHPKYYIGSVSYRADSIAAESDASPLSISFLRNKSELAAGNVYRERDAQVTYSNLSSLSAVVGANVTFTPSATAPDTLDAAVNLVMAKRRSTTLELEGTNSAGDFGAAISMGYLNRNLFRRSASLDVTLRGAYEAIHGLEGYNEDNYIEYSVESELSFPELIFPFVSRQLRHRQRAQSIAAVMYDSQDRPEFHRRVLTAAWRYRLNSRAGRVRHSIDLVDLDYVFMPWISETFRREYLTDVSSRNAILRFNYENLFIMRWGYTFRITNLTQTEQTSYGRNAYSLRIGAETAGNLLRGLSGLLKAQHSEQLDAYTLFNIAYAQYAKLDVDFAKSFRIDDRNSAAVHLAGGVAVPYGNSGILPYEKRYFSGGANSVRGWAVRGLGPGSFSGTDGRIDFIHQTGDMRLDASAEWRTHLFWKLDGAAFVDAGNVWTLRDYEEQPGGQFRFDKFWKQIAMAYGLGIRLNFGYFIIRLDAGMKAIDPAYSSGKRHYPIAHPDFKRDFHLHFAVGLPY